MGDPRRREEGGSQQKGGHLSVPGARKSGFSGYSLCASGAQRAATRRVILRATSFHSPRWAIPAREAPLLASPPGLFFSGTARAGLHWKRTDSITAGRTRDKQIINSSPQRKSEFINRCLLKTCTKLTHRPGRRQVDRLPATRLPNCRGRGLPSTAQSL